MTADTLLLRQIHPAHIKESAVSTQPFEVASPAFTPNAADKGLLSVYNGDRFTADEAYHHYTVEVGNTSSGVLAVSCAECAAENLPSAEDNNPFPGHAHVDFNGLPSKGAIKRAASNLRDRAMARGWMYGPVTTD